MDPTKKELYTAKRSSGLDSVSDPQVVERLKDFKFNDEHQWILFSLDNTTLRFHAISGNISNLSSHFDESSVYYGALKAKVENKLKVFVFTIIGEQVGGLKRGKAPLYKSAAFNLIDNHGEIHFGDILGKDINLVIVKDGIHACQGCSIDVIELIE